MPNSEGSLEAGLEKANLIVRDMCSADLEQVLTIERNAHISPWSRLSFEESLTKQECQESYCRVIVLKENVIAYFVVCPVFDELHILNIVAGLNYQGIGLGHMLMQEIIALAEDSKLKKIFLEVRLSNEIAQSLYLKWQFKQIAIRKRYYSIPGAKNINDKEDALIFLRQLS